MRNNKEVSKNLEKLSSGYAINKAGDDAAGLAISEKMRSQITGINTAIKNAQDGISLVQTAEGALTEVHSMLNRMVELATQSANGIYEETDRQAMTDEFDHLRNEIDRIGKGTDFNNRILFDGTVAKGKQIAFSGVNGENKFGINLKFNFPDSKTDIKIVFNMATKNPVAVDYDSSTHKPSIAIQLDVKGVYNQTIPTNTIITGEDIENAIKEHIKQAGALNNITDEGIKNEFIKEVNAMKVTGNIITPSHLVPEPLDINVQFNNNASTIGYVEIGNEIALQIGDTNDEFNKISIHIAKIDSEKLGLNMLSLENDITSMTAVKMINEAINTVSKERGKFGALQNRLEHTINNLSVNAENMTAAESRIRDVDIAKVMMEYTKNNILAQSAQSMLAHANQEPQGVLQLLQ